MFTTQMVTSILIITNIILCFFVIFAYRQGIEDGRAIKQETILPTLNSCIKIKEDEVEEDILKVSLNELINYDPYSKEGSNE